jgi:hypothetical protein
VLNSVPGNSSTDRNHSHGTEYPLWGPPGPAPARALNTDLRSQFEITDASTYDAHQLAWARHKRPVGAPQMTIAWKNGQEGPGC